MKGINLNLYQKGKIRGNVERRKMCIYGKIATRLTLEEYIVKAGIENNEDINLAIEILCN